jgi:hypothetical protein
MNKAQKVFIVETGLWMVASIILALDFFELAPMKEGVIVVFSALVFFYFSFTHAVFHQRPMFPIHSVNFLSKEGVRELPVYLVSFMLSITLLGFLFEYMQWNAQAPLLPIGLAGITCTMVFHFIVTFNQDRPLFMRLLVRSVPMCAVGLFILLIH